MGLLFLDILLLWGCDYWTSYYLLDILYYGFVN